MASSVVVQSTCDSCVRYGIEGVPAPHKHKISIDGGKEKNIDLCDRCDQRDFGPILVIYLEEGQEVEMIERATRKSKKSSEDAAPEQEAAEDEGLYVFCPIVSEHRVKEPQRVKYSDKNAHAEAVHQLKGWQVSYVYPGDREWFPCTVHKECVDSGNKFKSHMSVVRHIASVDLERIDEAV